ncbi:Cohesin subunit SA-1 [Caligus rogercresseyi]|uniref:Cohesin subunit SA-1 n=1 Tax=Caligus rogercresseyi TaxID=217165 RepID=A0A7T8HM46_CALRO|nr:Cohesin subunit SA-1 [Caligus rogercresseyi]
MAHLFQEVFANRFRDVFHKIRSACIHELGLWMLTFPKQFLDDAYLKYIAWSLHDAKGSVRLASLEALQPLYEKNPLESIWNLHGEV